MGTSEPFIWKGHDATRLSNGVVELVSLTRGGHLAEFRFTEASGLPTKNVLWEAPWMLSGATNNSLEELTQTAGLTGHGLCLDYFGAPSADETNAGLGVHGEAATAVWNVSLPAGRQEAAAQWNVRLRVAQLEFERKIYLEDQESVAYVEESVSNQRGVDHACHWVQHATFSPPFLTSAESTLAVSSLRGITSPSGYEDFSLLAGNREFSWPYAPSAEGNSLIDLRQPFSVKGRGFSAAIQLDPGREMEYLVAMNWKLRLGIGYCFRRRDFPWIAIWEENCARQDSPWNGNTQARGMEFGTTPFPWGREEIFRRGPIFETPSWCVIPALGTRSARYSVFLFTIPQGMTSIQNVEASENAIILWDQNSTASCSVPSSRCRDFLFGDA